MSFGAKIKIEKKDLIKILKKILENCWNYYKEVWLIFAQKSGDEFMQ